MLAGSSRTRVGGEEGRGWGEERERPAEKAVGQRAPPLAVIDTLTFCPLQAPDRRPPGSAASLDLAPPPRAAQRRPAPRPRRPCQSSSSSSPVEAHSTAHIVRSRGIPGAGSAVLAPAIALPLPEAWLPALFLRAPADGSCPHALQQAPQTSCRPPSPPLSPQPYLASIRISLACLNPHPRVRQQRCERTSIGA